MPVVDDRFYADAPLCELALSICKPRRQYLPLPISDIVCQSQCLIGRHLSQSNIAEEVVSVRKKKWMLCRYESVQSDSTNFSQYLKTSEKASNKDLASTRGLCDLSLRLDVNADCLANACTDIVWMHASRRHQAVAGNKKMSFDGQCRALCLTNLRHVRKGE
jgi:hypothetical protein